MIKLFGGKPCKQGSSIYVYLVIVKVCVDENILVQPCKIYTVPTVQI